MKKCQFCAEEIQDEAVVCRYCGRDLRAARLVVLRELRQAGQLEGRTLQEIGDRLEVNRSTVLRNLRELDELEPVIQEIREMWKPPPLKSPGD